MSQSYVHCLVISVAYTKYNPLETKRKHCIVHPYTCQVLPGHIQDVYDVRRKNHASGDASAVQGTLLVCRPPLGS